MKRTLIALAMALALCGCASSGTPSADSGQANGSETAEAKPKTKRVCTGGERSTGSHMRARTCKTVVISESESGDTK